jgi:hypothetical protein
MEQYVYVQIIQVVQHVMLQILHVQQLLDHHLFVQMVVHVYQVMDVSVMLDLLVMVVIHHYLLVVQVQLV